MAEMSLFERSEILRKTAEIIKKIKKILHQPWLKKSERR